MSDNGTGAEKSRRFSRRGFVSSVTAGAVTGSAAIAAGQAPPAAQPAAVEPEGPGLIRVALDVNGRSHRLAVEPRWTLLYVLRDRLGLMGAKPGCERGECGACTVLIDGVARYACMTLAAEAEGAKITTVEGLMRGEEMGAVQRAFVEEDAFQCGFCTPGQVMAVEGLLRRKPAPSTAEIREGVSGNICRCGAYPHIFAAAKKAADLKQKERS